MENKKKHDPWTAPWMTQVVMRFGHLPGFPKPEAVEMCVKAMLRILVDEEESVTEVEYDRYEVLPGMTKERKLEVAEEYFEWDLQAFPFSSSGELKSKIEYAVERERKKTRWFLDPRGNDPETKRLLGLAEAQRLRKLEEQYWSLGLRFDPDNLVARRDID